MSNRVLVGSHFWGYNIEGSDKDYIEVVIPTKKDLWKGNMLSKHTTSDEVDVAYKDIRQLIKELKKGSIRTMESLFGEVVDSCDDNFRVLRVERDFLVEDLRGLLIKQAQGELKSHYERYKLNPKAKGDSEKQKIILIKLSLIITALDAGKNPFNHKLPILKAIREDKLPIQWSHLCLIVEPALKIDANKYTTSYKLLDEIENDIMIDVFC